MRRRLIRFRDEACSLPRVARSRFRMYYHLRAMSCRPSIRRFDRWRRGSRLHIYGWRLYYRFFDDVRFRDSITLLCVSFLGREWGSVLVRSVRSSGVVPHGFVLVCHDRFPRPA